MRIETLAVHSGRNVDPTTGAVTPPIHKFTTFEREPDGTYPTGFVYGRSGNPTRTLLEDGGSGRRHARVLWCGRCARGEGRGAADQDRVVVSTGRPIRCPRSDDQEGEGARTATVEEDVW